MKPSKSLLFTLFTVLVLAFPWAPSRALLNVVVDRALPLASSLAWIGGAVREPLHDVQSLVDGPLTFVENTGQWPEDARFQVWHGGQGALWLAGDGLWLTLVEPGEGQSGFVAGEDPNQVDSAQVARRAVNIRLRFVGANPSAATVPSEPVATRLSYFIGADAAAWRVQVPVWRSVRYADLYPGVDLELKSEAAGWSWRLVGQDAEALQAVRLSVEGADAVSVNGTDLILSALGSQYALPLPQSPASYQVDTGQTITVVQPPSSESHSAATAPEEMPRAPDGLLFSTYLGGVFEDVGRANAIDYAGRVYVAGWTESPNFPVTPGAVIITQRGEIDAYVARLSSDGSTLDYATFLGGSTRDGSQSLAVDFSGRAYVSGWTNSADFPTTPNAFDRSYNGGDNDVFVLRLNEAGTALDYSTYLGGTGWDKSVATAVDGAGRAYVAGYLFSTDFPTTVGAFDRTPNGNRDGFITRFNATGSSLDYSSYLGGSGSDWAMAVTADGGGRAYVTGYTASDDFPTTFGAYDRTFNGANDAFIVRLTNTGSTLEYSTFLGSVGSDASYAITVDNNGQAYVTGETNSTGFPTTAGAFDRSFNGQVDAFAVKLSAGGNSLNYSTFLGGSDVDHGYGIAVDSAGRAHVTGDTFSANFPTSANGYDPGFNGGSDAFLATLSNSGDALTYATFIGGTSDDKGFGVKLLDSNTVAISGDTISGNFPVTASAFDPYFNGFTDAFAIKLEFVATPTPTFTWTPTPTHTWTPTPTRTWTPTSTWTPTPTVPWTPTWTATPIGGTGRSRFLPLLVRAAVPTPTPTPTRTPVPGDPFEPNNSFSQAWGPLVSGQVYRALIYAPGDQEDFYWFDMPSARSIQVDLWNIPAGNDYHLYLYNAGLSQVGYSGNPGNQPESIATSVLPPGLYYVRVQQVAGYSATQQYSLQSFFR